MIKILTLSFLFLGLLPAQAQYSSLEFFTGGIVGYQGSKSWDEFRNSYNATFEEDLQKPLGTFGLLGGYTFGFLVRTGGFMGLGDFGSIRSGAKVKYDDGRIRHFERYNDFINAEMGLGRGDAEANQYIMIGMAYGSERITTYLEYPDGGINTTSNMVLNGTYTAYHLRLTLGLRFSGGSFPGFGYYAGVYFMPSLKNKTGKFNDFDHMKALVNDGLMNIPRDYEAYVNNSFSNDLDDELYVQSDPWYFAIRVGIRYALPFN